MKPRSAGYLYVIREIMDRATFEKALTMVRATGLAVATAEYSEKSFGSWYITIAAEPKRRLVWDGKERWYVVEEETSEQWNGMPKWKDLWIERVPDAKSVVNAVRALCAGREDDQVRA